MDGRLRKDWETRQKAAVQEGLLSGTALVRLARSEGRSLGFVHGHIAEHLVLDDVAGFVDHAYVLPDARRRGLLSALLERLEQWFVEQGADGAQLYVIVGNTGASRAWAARGYRPYMDRLRKPLQ